MLTLATPQTQPCMYNVMVKVIKFKAKNNIIQHCKGLIYQVNKSKIAKTPQIMINIKINLAL